MGFVEGPPPSQLPQPPTSPMQPPPYLLPPPRRSHAARNLAIALVLIALLAFVAVEYRSSSVDITLLSNHITNTVAFTLTFDGHQIDSGSLAPGEKAFDRVPLSWWFVDCEVHSIVANATGGGLGPTSDSATPVTCSGTSYAISLSI